MTDHEVTPETAEENEMSAQSEIDALANFIMAEVEGEPSQNEGAGHTAIRIIRRLLQVERAAKFMRNVIIWDDPKFVGRWVAVPENDFMALRRLVEGGTT